MCRSGAVRLAALHALGCDRAGALLPPLGVLVTLACAPAEEPTTVIDSDTTWAAAASPVQIQDNIRVAAGVTLTIEPGVIVEIAPARGISVEGQLIAKGRAEAPIVFTLAPASRAGERWGSLSFEEGAAAAVFSGLDRYESGSIVEHCLFEHGTKALRITGSSPYVARSTFRHNQTEGAIDIAGGAAISVIDGARPRIADNTFRDNTAQPFTYGGAIFVLAADPLIQDNLFADNWGSYAGAIMAALTAGPIAGNTFTGNRTITKGGAVALISAVPTFVNNEVTDNHAQEDGGGLHGCVTCFPHATPSILDSVFVANSSSSRLAAESAGGIGLAYARMFRGNVLQGNLLKNTDSELGWFHPLDGSGEPWMARLNASGNYWGTTVLAEIEAVVRDGKDDPALGTVELTPLLDAAPSAPQLRVTVATRRLVFDRGALPARGLLTLYNPGPARSVELRITLAHDDAPPQPHTAALDFPGWGFRDGAHLLDLPDNGLYFTELEPPVAAPAGPSVGRWRAWLVDPSDGVIIGEPCEARFDIL